ncbi:hypothetical protein V502_02927 [Pseudogymnoascus sp. VKM F-4520 (FW-2644)]|nr:hypothetical protein V502_02927 [Pseudogymnoascus sp. VKM F-4520 (FW-2644)]
MGVLPPATPLHVTQRLIFLFVSMERVSSPVVVATLLPLLNYVLSIGFGITIDSNDHPYLKLTEDANFATTNGGSPASTIVDYFPIFKYVPNWLARSKPLKHARHWKYAILNLHEIPFANLQKEIKEGIAQNCIAQTLLEESATREENGEAEIDVVVGSDRLPNFEDRERLRYIDFIVQEAFRWAPLSPLGVPHRSIEDDTYNGMFIPAGTTIYANARAMCYDETMYKNPSKFNPNRFTPREEGGEGEPTDSRLARKVAKASRLRRDHLGLGGESVPVVI